MNVRSRRAMLRAAALGLPALACTNRRARSGPVRRVVTLGPNVTETLFALGAGDTVVGVSRYDDYPPEARTRARVGGLVDPSFEAIVALRPDALCGARGPVNRSVLDRVERLGIRTLFPPFESIADVRAGITAFAHLVGRTGRVAALHSDIDRRVDGVRARVRDRARPRVLAVFGLRPISVAGPGSFIDELITVAGGTNVATGPARWPTLGLESVLSLAPEIVLDLSSMEGHEPLAHGWAEHRAIPAVRNGRVVTLADPMLMRPGPRIGLALERFASAIHPEA